MIHDFIIINSVGKTLNKLNLAGAGAGFNYALFKQALNKHTLKASTFIMNENEYRDIMEWVKNDT